MSTLDCFTRSYLETILWSENDESDDSGGEPLDSNYGIEDFSPEAIVLAVADCKAFQAANAEDIDQVPTSPDGNPGDNYAGYLFWLTRVGHGTGFWDHEDEFPEGVAERLTAASKAAGERYVYVGDDGQIHMS